MKENGDLNVVGQISLLIILHEIICKDTYNSMMLIHGMYPVYYLTSMAILHNITSLQTQLKDLKQQF